MQEYKDLSGLPAPEQVLWLLTKQGRFLFRDVRKILCFPVHKELRFNLREWLARRLRGKIHYVTVKALKLVLWKVAGRHLTWKDYSCDPDFQLCWLTEFAFRVHPGDCFSAPEVFGDGSVAREETQQELEDRFSFPSLRSPSDPEVLLPKVHPSFRSHLPPELQCKVLEQLGPQAICDVLVSCFGRGDKAWDRLCVQALENSVRKKAFAFVKEGLADDLELLFSAEAREYYWDELREGIVSPLWGFPWLTGDLYGRQREWGTAGFHRAHIEHNREREARLSLLEEPVAQELARPQEVNAWIDPPDPSRPWPGESPSGWGSPPQ